MRVRVNAVFCRIRDSTRRARWAPLLLALTLFTPACRESPLPAPQAGLAATPVVLTFEVAGDADAAALRELAFDRPATFFIAGAFAERHPALVRALAGRSTIGSLAYAGQDLTRLDLDALHRELLLGKLVLERAAGRPVEWFRAPALASSPAVFRELKQMGFGYDSSDLERWPRQFDLYALPVSTEDRGERPASDHELFGRAGLSDADALAWLIARYEERAATGRPLVVALQPRVIAAHRPVLDGFIAHVDRRGGLLLSADGYAERAMQVRPDRFGVWVDFSQGPHDAAQLARDVEAAGITDVFLQVKDPDGNRYYASPGDGGPVPRDSVTEAFEALQRTRVRVHAWIAVGRDPYLAQRHPDWAMTSIGGERSRDWISPSNPAVRAAVRATVSELLDRFPLAGVHLDYLRYPSFEYDFSPEAVGQFQRAAGLDGESGSLREMFDRRYNAWIAWRCDQITELTGEVDRLLASRAGPRAVLSAALLADAATSYRVMEEMAQDYSALARHLQAIVPMAYIKSEQRPVDWISKVALAARYRAGNRELLAGLEAYQRSPEISYDTATFRAAMDAAGRGYAGQVFYAYSFLFGRGASGANMPAGSLAALKAFRSSLNDPAARDSNAGVPPRPDASEPSRFPWVVYPIAALVFAVAATAAAVGRAMRAGRDRGRVLPDTGATADAVPLDPEWRRVERDHAEGTAEDRERIQRLLVALTPSAIDRLRAAYLIESLGEDGVSEANLLAAVDGIALARRDVLDAIERAGEIGAVELRDGLLRPTSRGRADLEAARARGYHRTTWHFIETLLGAEGLAACPACRAPNLPLRARPMPGCARCGYPLTA